MKRLSEENLHRLFKAGTILKAIDSVIETALGVSFIFLSTATINAVIFAITGDELIEQPRDAIWNLFFHNFNGLTHDFQIVLAFLFIGHGILKLLLVAGMKAGRIWIYPVAAAVFAGFIGYQVYHITFSFSIILILMTLYDAAFTALIIHEYRYQKRRSGAGAV
jgi:uncharacterized membrane protein